MRIFCDTNIVMEFLQERKFFLEVKQILTNAINNGDTLYISYGSFYTITYLTEMYLKADKSLSKEMRINKLRYILNGILNTFFLADQHASSIIAGVNDLNFDDLEDSYQAHIAEHAACDVLLTINEKHFARYSSTANMNILTPVEFIKQYI